MSGRHVVFGCGGALYPDARHHILWSQAPTGRPTMVVIAFGFLASTVALLLAGWFEAWRHGRSQRSGRGH
jgi:hypothetical protein